MTSANHPDSPAPAPASSRRRHLGRLLLQAATATFGLAALFFLAVVVVIPGCSSFGREWDAAVAAARGSAEPFATLDGPWRGTWRSEPTGHRGELRCLITPSLPEEKDGEEERERERKPEQHQERESAPAPPSPEGAARVHTARFKARWASIFTFEYTLEIEAREEGPAAWSFEGSADLGWPWGEYRFRGEAAGNRFTASYEAAGDHGTFELQRVGPLSSVE